MLLRCGQNSGSSASSSAEDRPTERACSCHSAKPGPPCGAEKSATHATLTFARPTCSERQRCKGVIDGVTGAGGSAAQLPLPPTAFGNPTAVAEAIKAQLLKNPAIDGVITISAGDADSAANGIMQAGAPGCNRPPTAPYGASRVYIDHPARSSRADCRS